jgi:hypothetical protein
MYKGAITEQLIAKSLPENSAISDESLSHTSNVVGIVQSTVWIALQNLDENNNRYRNLQKT